MSRWIFVVVRPSLVWRLVRDAVISQAPASHNGDPNRMELGVDDELDSQEVE
jgi:hypothetical protein